MTVTIPACGACCDLCDAMPDEFDVTVSGVVSCGCVDADTNSHVVSSFTGHNGSWVAVYNETSESWVIENFGTWTYDTHFGLGCAAFDGSVTVYFTAYITCATVAGLLTMNVWGDTGGYPSPDTIPVGGYFAFSTTTTGTRGDTFDNSLCVDPAAVGDGTTTIE